MAKKITTLEDLGDLVQTIDTRLKTHSYESAESFKSIGDQLVKIEDRLEEIPTRGELGELIAKVYDVATVNTRLERIEKYLHLDDGPRTVHVER